MAPSSGYSREKARLDSKRPAQKWIMQKFTNPGRKVGSVTIDSNMIDCSRSHNGLTLSCRIICSSRTGRRQATSASTSSQSSTRLFKFACFLPSRHSPLPKAAHYIGYCNRASTDGDNVARRCRRSPQRSTTHTCSTRIGPLRTPQNFFSCARLLTFALSLSTTASTAGTRERLVCMQADAKNARFIMNPFMLMIDIHNSMMSEYEKMCI